MKRQRVESPLTPEQELEAWNLRRMQACQITGSTYEFQENMCGPDALRRALSRIDG